MNRRILSRIHPFLVVGAALVTACPARAEPMTTHQCVEANKNGQELLIAGHLTAARVQFHACSVNTCPAIIKNDCTTRLDALDAVQPAIIFQATDAGGHDIATVTVTIDGAALASRLDGTPLRVDPGEHTFVFTTPGVPPTTKTYVLAERDQARRERVTLGAPPPPVETPVPSPTAPVVPTPLEPVSATEHRGMSTMRVAGIVVGGVGLLGLGFGAIFGVSAGSAATSAQNDCPSAVNCPNHPQALSERSAFYTDRAVEVASLIGGGALLVGGLTLVVAGRSNSLAKIGLSASPMVSLGVSGILLQGRF